MLLARFAIVGVLTSLVYVVSYPALHAAGIARPVASIVGYAAAVLFQYVGHSLFTFRTGRLGGRQAARFVAAICVGIALSTIVTSLNGVAYKVNDTVLAVLIVSAIPIANFFLFRLWVFRPRADSAIVEGGRAP